MSARPLFIVMIIAGVLALITGYLLPSGFIEASGLSVLASYVAMVAPSVDVIASHALDPPRAAATWAVQWLFSPICVLTWIVVGKPWGSEMRKGTIKLASTLSRRGNFFVPVISIIFFLSVILSDLGIIHWISFLRGTPFEYDGDRPPVMTILRAPYTSNFGMVFTGWAMPFCNAAIYSGLIFYIFNAKYYLRRGLGSDSQEL